MSLDANEMTDALDFQSMLWAELAKHLQGIWKGLAEAFEQFRLDPTFISDIGLATFLPIYGGIETNVIPSTANQYGASGMMIYENKKGS